MTPVLTQILFGRPDIYSLFLVIKVDLTKTKTLKYLSFEKSAAYTDVVALLQNEQQQREITSNSTNAIFNWLREFRLGFNTLLHSSLSLLLIVTNSVTECLMHFSFGWKISIRTINVVDKSCFCCCCVYLQTYAHELTYEHSKQTFVHTNFYGITVQNPNTSSNNNNHLLLLDMQ